MPPDTPPVSAKEEKHLRLSGLTGEQRWDVLKRVADCLARIHSLLPVHAQHPKVLFDLAGTAAGQYRRVSTTREGIHVLRFNPYLLARHFDESLHSTVPHEVAHYAVASIHQGKRLPHGPEWRGIMKLLGADASVTHGFAVNEAETRRQRRWPYHCACREHALSTTRHQRALRGTKYLCRACGGRLRYRDD
jgi:SprT protein